MTRTISVEATAARNSTTAVPNPRIQENGTRVYFQRNLFRAYDSSADSTPPSASVLRIFGRESGLSSSSVLAVAAFIHDIGHMPHSSDACSTSDLIDYLLRDASFLFSQGVDRIYQKEKEDSLYLDDVRREGFTVDWQRARELYQKLLQQ
jgi:hypothetical protein